MRKRSQGSKKTQRQSVILNDYIGIPSSLSFDLPVFSPTPYFHTPDYTKKIRKLEQDLDKQQLKMRLQESLPKTPKSSFQLFQNYIQQISDNIKDRRLANAINRGLQGCLQSFIQAYQKPAKIIYQEQQKIRKRDQCTQLGDNSVTDLSYTTKGLKQILKAFKQVQKMEEPKISYHLTQLISSLKQFDLDVPKLRKIPVYYELDSLQQEVYGKMESFSKVFNTSVVKRRLKKLWVDASVQTDQVENESGQYLTLQQMFRVKSSELHQALSQKDKFAAESQKYKNKLRNLIRMMKLKNEEQLEASIQSLIQRAESLQKYSFSSTQQVQNIRKTHLTVQFKKKYYKKLSFQLLQKLQGKNKNLNKLAQQIFTYKKRYYKTKLNLQQISQAWKSQFGKSFDFTQIQQQYLIKKFKIKRQKFLQDFDINKLKPPKVTPIRSSSPSSLITRNIRPYSPYQLSVVQSSPAATNRSSLLSYRQHQIDIQIQSQPPVPTFPLEIPLKISQAVGPELREMLENKEEFSMLAHSKKKAHNKTYSGLTNNRPKTAVKRIRNFNQSTEGDLFYHDNRRCGPNCTHMVMSFHRRIRKALPYPLKQVSLSDTFHPRSKS